MVSMSPNIPKNNGNFCHKKFEKSIISFIICMDCFKPKEEITFVKNGGDIIFNSIPNSLNKMATFKNVVNIFTISIAKITSVFNF